ncbi:hypothetical protein BDW62DRAFT_175401 [Aspergillus aurantiobrunneus]
MLSPSVSYIPTYVFISIYARLGVTALFQFLIVLYLIFVLEVHDTQTHPWFLVREGS